ncbi:prolyl oligopeptidase family [Pseudoalteromonas luteoviolacea 2ta16]|uniref:Prolyl oligopeptidase family n=2 Tax=Pseudoalteromonas luteoviolacea TaxID=43657 RepID=V4I3B2_PSEL2|nr:prolyl oligopeptidase family [Pseudoalteromonas luteoviolacea 2ta16]
MIIIRALILFVCACVLSNGVYANPSSYKQPSAEIAELIQHHSVPKALVNAKGSWMALLTPLEADNTGKSLGQQRPPLSILGVQINPETSLRPEAERYAGVSFKHIDTGALIKVNNIPEGHIIQPTWSANGRYLAFILETQTGGYLWVYDIKQRQPKSLSNFPLNGFTMAKPFEWLADSSGLIANIRVNHSRQSVTRSAEQSNANGPLVVNSTAQIKPSDAFDAPKHAQFTQLALGQLYKVPLKGREVPIGQPAYFSSFKASPDSTNLLVAMMDIQNLSQMTEEDFDKQHYSVWQIWGMRGAPLYEVYRPQVTVSEQDSLTQPFTDATVKRVFQWRADKGATLIWAQSDLDSDSESLYSISAPFRRNPRHYADIEGRLSEIMWGDNQLGLMVIDAGNNEKDYYAFSPLTPDRAQVKLNLFEGLSKGESRELVTTKNDIGASVIKVAGGRYIFITGTKKQGEADIPYLARFDARGNLMTPIWESKSPYFERVVAVLSDDGMQFVTRKESKDNPTNYFSRNLTFDVVEQLTKYPHPYPSMQGIRKEEMRFSVGAGGVIKGDFYLPKSFDPSMGRVPVVVWLNDTNEQNNKQVISSPYLFPDLDAKSGVPFVHEGYAVLNIKNMPMLSAQNQGEQFDQQLRASAKAIVDTLVSQGIADKEKIAIGGHGFAATSVLKLLTQTDYFVTGIARSGTYNLTLSPFVFGAGEQSLWVESSKYLANSPLFSAQNIRSSVLLIHGYQDRKEGSYPVQSERMFSALNDLGKTAKLVLLPNSGHEYQDEKDLLHMLYEQQQWLKLHFATLPEIEPSSSAPENLHFELEVEVEESDLPSPWG